MDCGSREIHRSVCHLPIMAPIGAQAPLAEGLRGAPDGGATRKPHITQHRIHACYERDGYPLENGPLGTDLRNLTRAFYRPSTWSIPAPSHLPVRPAFRVIQPNGSDLGSSLVIGDLFCHTDALAAKGGFGTPDLSIIPMHDSGGSIPGRQQDRVANMFVWDPPHVRTRLAPGRRWIRTIGPGATKREIARSFPVRPRALSQARGA